MSKKWKIDLTNNLCRIFSVILGRLKDTKDFHSGINYSSIVIYSTTALGDLMFNTPAIRAIRERFPAAKLTLVSSLKNKAIVEKCDYFSHVVYWDQKVIDMLPAVMKIRRQKPELAVLLHSKQPYDVLCAVMSGANFIIRDNYSPQPMGMERWFADYSRAYDGHLIQRKMKLVSGLGCATDNISMFVPAPFTPIIRDREKKIVAFQMGASNQLRCWPVSRFVELAKLILAVDQRYSIALIGTTKELELATSFLSAFESSDLSRITSYVGNTTLTELLAYIDSFDVLVTGDTGPLHLAIALKTPTVSLFATANPASTGPLQDPELHQVIKINIEDYELTEEQRLQPLILLSAETVFDKVMNRFSSDFSSMKSA